MQAENHAKLLLLAGLVPALTVAALGYMVLPQIVALYAAADVALPLATRMLFASYRWYVFFPVIVMLAWAFWPNRSNRGMAAALLGSIGSALLFAFGYWAMHLPLSHLEALP